MLNQVVKEISEDSTCDGHKEADSKIDLHACNMRTNSEILIKYSDTDISIIMLASMRHLLHRRGQHCKELERLCNFGYIR